MCIHASIHLHMHAYKCTAGQDRRRRVTTTERGEKGSSSVRHSGVTVMMNADRIYGGGKWV